MNKYEIITKFEHCYIKEKDFRNKEDYRKVKSICKNLNENENVNFLFTNDGIKLNQHVGVISFGENKYIEILPKLFDNNRCTSNLPESATVQGRKLLTKLLLIYLGIDPRVVDYANLNYDRFPLWDVFITVFINEVSKIIKQGLKKKYIKQKNNSKYLKGKLLVVQNIRKNTFNIDRFFIEYEKLSPDIPENRILKTSLKILRNSAISSSLKRKIDNLLFDFNEISYSDNIYRDIKNTYIDRTFSHYSYAVRLAEIFLQGKSFSTVLQNDNQRERMVSLLFDMNKLFESYVAYILKNKYKLPIETQKSDLYLSKEKVTGKSIFQLRPDLYLETSNKICILDTKWKKISNKRNNDNYGISQSDMYQMLAYAVRYEKEKVKPVDIYLIYPKYELFNEKIELVIPYFQRNIPVTILPFDLENDKLKLNCMRSKEF